MINGVIINALSKNLDNRGWLTEIYRQDDNLFNPAMGYISVTKPGVVRGPHEHVHQTDCFIFVGPGSFELYLWDNREDSQTKNEYMKISAGQDNPTKVIVPPGVVHGYKCISNTDGYCLNLPDKLYRGREKKEEVDEIRWENQNNSKFIIN
jgi:dTDP-4-dehydrorhamnose 3,5-epimerase